MARSIIRRAVRKARRFVGRIVYVVRDYRGRVHYSLSNHVHGFLLLLCGASRDGTVTIIRHVV